MKIIQGAITVEFEYAMQVNDDERHGTKILSLTDATTGQEVMDNFRELLEDMIREKEGEV